MLTSKKIGFIGGGAMAEAIIKGLVNSGLSQPANIIVSDVAVSRLEYLVDKLGVSTMSDNSLTAKQSDILFLAVKPQVIKNVLKSLETAVSESTLVISIAAGICTAMIEEYFPKSPVIRVMPNTPIAVSAGMSAIALGKNASKDHSEIAINIFSSSGQAIVINEASIDAVTGLSGSGPGYGFLMIDALADAGVKVGLSRQDAITLAAQSLFGAAKMVLETGEHPAKLRDMVTSPAGTTIAGIHVLEQRGVRAALIDAVITATERSAEMGKC
ncbi:Pyrroline-5-carboxylate reductase [bioreactor metagenome]|uniref:Pyrroline-5-carboxylate reductase n=1 Tax=bioreactor metagenome TaxID=1076179 RepID=A0A644T2N3_9ZZZZ|nr:pyrroline-5-carboxylate reductase [Negativicutes bacterium]